jgi:ATP-dependent RNA helicase DeaD
MASFEDLGIREPLLRVLEEEELEIPTALQEAVVPVLRRGGNLVARASSGAGKTLAYGLGVLDRPRAAAGASEEADEAGESAAAPAGPRVLVLVPAAEAAEHVATALFPYAQAVELEVTAADAAWATRPAEAGVVVSTPAALLDAVRGSALKLDAVDAVVIDDAASIHALGGWDAVDTLLDHLPREAQRVVV